MPYMVFPIDSLFTIQNITNPTLYFVCLWGGGVQFLHESPYACLPSMKEN